MRTLVNAQSHSGAQPFQRVRCLSATCLFLLGLFSSATANADPAAFNHPPKIGFIKDQALKTQNLFSQVYFSASDNETTLDATKITPVVENDPASPNFYSGGVHVAACSGSDIGCPQDGYKLTFDPVVNGNGAATIRITVTDGALTAASSFTLRKNSLATNPPVIGGIPNETIQSTSNASYGPVGLVVGDLDSTGKDDAVDALGNSRLTFTSLSDNTGLVPTLNIAVTPLGGMEGRAFQMTALPAANQFGRAVITIIATDPEGFATSTSFVLDVFPNGNTPPSITGTGTTNTFLEQDVTQSTNAVYSFSVSDGQTLKKNLLVTAVSSNAGLVPNDATHLAISPDCQQRERHPYHHTCPAFAVTVAWSAPGCHHHFVGY